MKRGESERGKNEAKPRIKRPENANRTRLGNRHGRAKRHGQPCTGARPCLATHGRAPRVARPCHPSTAWPCHISGRPGCAGLGARFFPASRASLPRFARALLFFDARDVLEPLIFLEFTLEVFFSIKTQRFLLKWRQMQFRHKMIRRKIIWP